jgi:hypothetical protein
MEYLKLASGIVIVVFTGLLAGTILFWIWTGKILLYKLLSEPNGDASLSRLQFLIFTFVIALSFFLIIAGHVPPVFPAIPPEVLTLLGISGSSYLVSKAIQFSSPAGVARPALVIAPNTVQAGPGAAIPLFTASVVNTPAGSPLPALIWQLDAPALGGVVAMPPNQAQYNLPAAAPPAGTKVTLRATAAGFEDGIATVEF